METGLAYPQGASGPPTPIPPFDSPMRQGTLGAIVRARLTDFWRTLWACLFGQVGLARGAGTGSEGASGLVRTLSPPPHRLYAAGRVWGGVRGGSGASVLVGGRVSSPLGVG